MFPKAVMTYTKTILFASLMVAMILPFSAMNIVDAAPNENTNSITKGKLHITDVKDKKNDVQEMNSLYKIVKDEQSSKTDKDNASKRLNELKQQFENKGGKMSEERHMEIRGHIDSVTEQIDDLRNIYNIAIVTVGTDFENDSLRIGIDREGLTDSKVQNIEKQIRKIVGDEIGITIEYSDPVYFRCSQTGDCNPMQGGVRIQAEGTTPCSMGYKATNSSQNLKNTENWTK